jgi:hypothetical protein
MPNTDVLRGAYCPLIVPFRNQKIDYDTYGKLIERQIAEGTHGLLVNATSGEPTMLTLEERGSSSSSSSKHLPADAPSARGPHRNLSTKMPHLSIASTRPARIRFWWSRHFTQHRPSAGQCHISPTSARAPKDHS